MSFAGGSEVYIAGLKGWLREAGHEVQLLTCGPEGTPEADEHAFGTDNALAQVALQLVNPFATAAVRRMVRAFRPDAALVSHFAFHLSPAVLGALRPLPTVVSVMDYKVVCPLGSKLLPDGTICRQAAGAVCRTGGCVSNAHWLRDQPRYALIRSALTGVRRIICASTWIQGELARNGIDSECIPIPVKRPTVAFTRAPARAPTFVFVGRLSREKGVDVLLHAFRQLLLAHPGARLRVVGDGPLRAESLALAVSLGVAGSVEFTGAVVPSAVEALIADAWALVAPSRWAEPYGLVVPEAVLRGIPVVATAQGGFADTVEQGITGLLVPNGDAAQLAAALDGIASSRVFPRQAIPAGAVARLAERLSPRVYVERLEAILNASRP